MRSLFHRRRAVRFAQLLDEANGGRRHHARNPMDEELSNLVRAGKRLGAVTMPGGVRPAFRQELRAQLVAAAMREGVGRTIESKSHRVPPTRPSRTRIAIFSGVAIGALALSSVSVASGDTGSSTDEGGGILGILSRLLSTLLGN